MRSPTHTHMTGWRLLGMVTALVVGATLAVALTGHAVWTAVVFVAVVAGVLTGLWINDRRRHQA